jgi:lipid-binding SYLF domain-containing protein
MKGIVTLGIAVLLALNPVLSCEAAPDGREEKIVLATDILKEITVIPEKGIPPSLLNAAAGVAIIPNVIKIGFVIGGRHGTGILLVRGRNGQWSNPSFISLTGGSVGWQIGAQATDVILVFKNRKSIDGIMDGKFTLGADAAVAAGPVGRRGEAATDTMLKAEIYSYSRSRGLFAGVSLEGSALQIDDKANASYYGRRDITGRNVLTGAAGRETPEIARLRAMLAASTPKP